MTASFTTIKEKYDRIVGKLDSMAIDTALLDQRPDDAIFIDDMLLRLKLWSADIQYDQGSLEWAEKLVQLSVPLHELLQQLEQQCLLFDAVSKPGSAKGEDHHSKAANLCRCNSNKCRVNSFGQAPEDSAKNSHETPNNARDAARRSLRLSVDDLVAFASPIKLAACVPKVERTEETVSRVNQDVKKTVQPLPSKQFPYIMLGKPLPADLVEMLLGAVIIPDQLLEAGISSQKPPLVRIPRYTAKARIAESTMEVASTQIQTFRSDSYLLGTSTSPALSGMTAVKLYQLEKAEEYFEFFVEEHRDDLRKLFAEAPKANFVLASVLLTAQLPGEKDLTLPTGAVEHAKNESEQIFAFGCLQISDSLFGRPKLSREPGGLSRTYFVPRDLSLAPPPVGPLDLGSIVIDPRDVNTPINRNSRLEVPIDQLHRSYTSGVQSTSSRNGENGAWAKILSAAGLGGEAGLLPQRDGEATYKFDRLETMYFMPTEDYIRQSVEQSEVLGYIKASGYKPVFLVTGLKIVRGPALIQSRQTSIGHKAQLELGLPASIGPMTSQPNEITGTTVFDGSSDFIIGIRFTKITYRRQFLGAKRKVVGKDFYKGAALF